MASGPIVVLAALRMGPRPSYTQQLLLFELVAALTLAGPVLNQLPTWQPTAAVHAWMKLYVCNVHTCLVALAYNKLAENIGHHNQQHLEDSSAFSWSVCGWHSSGEMLVLCRLDSSNPAAVQVVDAAAVKSK